MIVREAHLKDASSIVDMWKDFMEEHDELVFKANPRIKSYIQKYLKRKEVAANLFKEYVQENIRADDARVLLVEVEGDPVGYCLTRIQSTIPIFIVEKIGFINDLFVRKEFRGMGLSSQLKNETIKWLKKKGITHVSVAVFADNEHARKIYKKWGFLDFQVGMRQGI